MVIQAPAMSAPFVIVSTNGNMTEAMADAAVRKIISIAETAPPEIKEQAIAFRGQMKEVVLLYMNKAIKAEFERIGLREK